MTDLEILKLRRKALLLAEAIGWLHDYRKCSEEHLQTLAANRQGQGIPRPELGKRYPGLQNIQIALVTTRDVLSLLNDKTWGQDLLGQLLSRCHNTSHFDKQEPTNGTQNFPGTQISSPFGFEQPVTSGLTSKMWGLPWNDLATISKSHSILRDSIRTLFSQAIADSRRPINEVDLWSWGSFVGVLYKSALAWMLLTGQSSLDPQKIRWRLLSIRTDGLEYISNVTRIPDLLARQKILSSALNRVRRLLETTYPLGSEVYRDQNGSVFVVPDISTLLDYTNDKGETLRYLVSQAFEQALEGDLAPQIELESTPWWGQDPGWPQS
ncbi:MAG: CRISPR-associated protein Csx11, partial [Deltaproteobacteria bacterium]|nr:CRISPR-associated protein Csx11 [Deltaproteobacteria bacterium]